MAGVWDVTTPVGTEAISNGDDRLRELKTAILNALLNQAATGTEAVFPGAAPTTAPLFRPRFLIGTTGARAAASADQGIYINTTLNTIQRCNDAAWVDVATLIPSGTKMAFYQASPPVGWTAVAVNDKFMRVVTSGGTGGTTGGSGATPSSTVTLAHTHTVASHTHTMGNHTHANPSHVHAFAGAGAANLAATATKVVMDTGDDTCYTHSGAGSLQALSVRTISDGSTTSGAPSTNTSDAASPATDSQLSNTAFQYADFCVGTKD